MLARPTSATLQGRAATIALGDGSRNDGIANSRQAPSQTRISATNVVVGASRSGQRAQLGRKRPRALSPGGGTGEELSTDMVREGMKLRL